MPTAASRPPAGSTPAVAAATSTADPERRAGVEPRSDAEVGHAAPPVGDAGDRQADEAGERDVNAVVDFDLGPATDRVPRRQRRPIPHAEFRQRLGNASHDETMHAAKRTGVRLVGSDKQRGRLDRQRATANQIATAARKVADPGMFSRAKVTVAAARGQPNDPMAASLRGASTQSCGLSHPTRGTALVPGQLTPPN